MPKLIVCIKECGLSPTGQAQLVYDLSTDYLDPNAGVPLAMGDQVMLVNLANSVVQINNGIKTAVLANLVSSGFPSHGMTSADITIFGGAQ